MTLSNTKIYLVRNAMRDYAYKVLERHGRVFFLAATLQSVMFGLAIIGFAFGCKTSPNPEICKPFSNYWLVIYIIILLSFCVVRPHYIDEARLEIRENDNMFRELINDNSV